MTDQIKRRETDSVVVVMLKAPREATVKTRLAAQIGAGAATAIYRLLVEHQMKSLPRDWLTEIHFSPADCGKEMEEWLGPGYTYFFQHDSDLGSRLKGAVTGAFARGARSVIVVGGDCPELDEECIRRACVALQTVDVAIGPAVDGGYYLLALRQAVPILFDRIPWSTENVLATSVLRIAEAGLSHTLLDAKEDVDDLASLRRVIDSTAFANYELRDKLVAWLPK